MNNTVKFREVSGKKKKRISKGTSILIIVVVITAMYFISWNIIHMGDKDYKDMLYGVDTGMDMEGYCFYYSQLIPAQKYVYQVLYRSCEKYQAEVLINDTSEADIKRAWYAFRCDHPEFFWIRDVVYWEDQENNVKRISIDVPKDVRGQQKAVEEEAEQFLQNLPESQLERAKTIYESIILKTDYNLNAKNNQDIRSVLLSHMSVCGGYSKTFLYLCNKAGVPCAYVEGEVLGRDTHAWNFIVLNGKYYWVDVTWGDPTYEYFIPHNANNISYDYFCIDDNTMLKDRILISDPRCKDYDKDVVFEYPSCKEISAK